MKEIEITSEKIVLKDNSILDFFEKEVTPHGTGAKIPCSSKYIGKKAYVVIVNNAQEKEIQKNNQKD